MIERIGVVCQDRNSFGFLEGLKRRLNCTAELIEPSTGALGKSTNMTRRQARIAARTFQEKGVDLVVRFTDSDANRWQDVRRSEVEVFPATVREILVCGVAVDNVEQWLALDRPYIANELKIPNVAQLAGPDLTGAIKTAIARQRSPDEPVSEVTARLVANAPPDVFREWLRADESLRHFYQECRAAAPQRKCDVPNELDQASQ